MNEEWLKVGDYFIFNNELLITLPALKGKLCRVVTSGECVIEFECMSEPKYAYEKSKRPWALSMNQSVDFKRVPKNIAESPLFQVLLEE